MRRNNIVKYLFIFNLFILSTTFADEVDVFPADSVELCIGGDYITLTTISVFEDGTSQGEDDIRHSSGGGSKNTGPGDFILKAPTGLQFNTANTNDTFWVNPGSGFRLDSLKLTVATDSIIFHYYIDNSDNQFDSFSISGLEIKAVSAGSGHILRVDAPSGDGFVLGDEPSDNVSHGYLKAYAADVIIADSTDILCFGAATGSAKARKITGLGTISYLWTPGGFTDTIITNVIAGSYKVVITDSQSCKDSATVTIDQPSTAVIASMIDSSDISCFGGNNGSATVRATGGTQGIINKYTYLWSPSGFTDTFPTNLSAGIHKAVVTDSNGCKDSSFVTLSQPAIIATSIDSIKNNVACGGSNGILKVSTSGGTLPYSFDWTPDPIGGDGDSFARDLFSGEYIVQITDGNLCTHSNTGQIDDPSNCLDPGIIDTIDRNICERIIPSDINSLQAASGGAGGYVYQWQKSINFDWANIPGENGLTLSFASALTQTTAYRRCVTSGVETKCTDAIEVKLISDPVLVWTGLNSQYCINSSNVNIISNSSPSGGIDTFWGPGITDHNNGTATFSPASAGIGSNYKIIYQYTNSSGCSKKDTQTVAVNSLPTITFTDPLSSAYLISDQADTIKATPKGGTFSGPGIANDSIFYPNAAGVGTGYIITYTYTNPTTGCTNSANNPSTITVNDTGGSIISGLSSAYCSNDTSTYILNGFPSPADSGENFEVFVSIGFPADAFTLTDNGNTTASFNPSLVTTPNSLTRLFIRYNFWKGGVYQSTIWYQVDINPPPSGFSIASGAGPYCKNGDTTILNANLSGGTFTGTAVISGNRFVPSKASIGANNVFYTYTDGNNCSNDTTFLITVNAIPSVNILGLDPAYCVNYNIDTLHGNPSGGTFTGSGIFSDSIFSPSIAGASITPYYIRYIYTDGNSCTNDTTRQVLVHDTPAVSFSGLQPDLIYCIHDVSSVLTGVPAGAGGVFSGQGINNGLKTFFPDSAGVGIFPITYTYTDGNTCTNNSTKNVEVKNRPTFEINFQDTFLCNKSAVYNMFVINQNPPFGSGVFTADGLQGSGSVIPAKYNPASADAGEDTVTYIYTDPFGCVNSSSVTVTVNPLPNVSFVLNNACSGDSLIFDNLSSVSLPDSLVSYRWDIDANGSIEDTTEDLKYFFTSSGSYDIELEVITAFGCSDKQTQLNLPVNESANAAFYWEKVCQGDSTLLIWDEALSEVRPDTFYWNVEDSIIKVISDTLRYVFTSAGQKLVSLTTFTTGCIDNDTNFINILPFYDGITINNEYFEDFENGQGGWLIGNDNPGITNSSWNFGTPNGDNIISASTGVNAWITNLDTAYNDNENSWVYSPCFNIDSLSKPIISLSTAYDINNTDGAIIRYSIDDGKSWELLGLMNSGVDWYTNSGIASNPGNQTVTQGGVGWSGQKSWSNSKHVLNDIKDKDTAAYNAAYAVRFQILFKSIQALSKGDGFAFDDVRISEREKLVLVEHFTNSSCTDCRTIDSLISNIVNKKSKDVAAIFYHTAFPGTDIMNIDNTFDPSTRAFFNGISNTPRTVLDGNYYNGNSLLWNEVSIDKRDLEDPKFDIDLDFSDPILNSQLDVSVKLTAIDTVLNPITIQIAIVERLVEFQQPESNGETRFQNVLKKMLPDASGTSIDQDWFPGTTHTIGQSIQTDNINIYDINQIGIIAFIQDNITKEVYQATYGGAGTPSVGIKSKYLSAEVDMRLFPNPAENHAIIAFNQILSDNYNLNITDQTGRLIEQIQIPKGSAEALLSLNAYSNGIYFVNITDNLGKIYSTRKLSVVHY